MHEIKLSFTKSLASYNWYIRKFSLWGRNPYLWFSEYVRNSYRYNGCLNFKTFENEY